jgi:hypothetical protein
VKYRGFVCTTFWWNILKTLKKMSDETSIVICKVMSNLSKFEEFPFKL